MSEQSERMKVASDALLACPFCGGLASPVIVIPSSIEHDPDAAFWGDRAKVTECRRAGCEACGYDMDAEKWQRRSNAPAHPRAVASRGEAGCSAIP